MKKQIVLFALITAVLITSVYVFKHRKTIFTNSKFLSENGEDNKIDIPMLWEKFQRDFRIHFDDSEEEEQYRFGVFSKNILKIQGKSGLSVTQFMHLNSYEFAEQTFGIVEKETGTYQKFQQISTPVQSIDWQTKGAVSPVKMQGLCASSWAFSVTAGVESALYFKNGSLPLLTEQNFLDCDISNGACNGGDREKAIKFVIEKGLNTQSENPYRAYQTKCKYSDKQANSISSYKTFTNCNDVLTALQSGPVIIAIDGTDLQFYKQGILDTDYNARNHGALLVGYNSEQGYWKIKSSLGGKFGESGFVRLSAAMKDGMIQNTAGICDKAFQVFA